jgi:hypothetical protein
VVDAGRVQSVQHEGTALGQDVDRAEALDRPSDQEFAAVPDGGQFRVDIGLRRQPELLQAPFRHPALHRGRARPHLAQQAPDRCRQSAVRLLLNP